MFPAVVASRQRRLPRKSSVLWRCCGQGPAPGRTGPWRGRAGLPASALRPRPCSGAKAKPSPCPAAASRGQQPPRPVPIQHGVATGCPESSLSPLVPSPGVLGWCTAARVHLVLRGHCSGRVGFAACPVCPVCRAASCCGSAVGLQAERSIPLGGRARVPCKASLSQPRPPGRAESLEQGGEAGGRTGSGRAPCSGRARGWDAERGCELHAWCTWDP